MKAGGSSSRPAGDTLVEGGRLDATSVGGKGGQVDVLGDRVAVMNDAQIDVSGTTGGGTFASAATTRERTPTSRTPALPISARMRY
jgi:hypothetical protein